MKRTEKRTKRVNVLVVEDEWLISAMTCDALEREGYGVYAVSSGEEALQYLFSGEPVDVLFTDINLPGEMSGSTLAARARELKPDIPVVYASSEGSFERVAKVPGSIFLPKPYGPEEACSAMARAVRAG